MKKALLAATGLALTGFSVSAQHISCGFDHSHEQQLKSNPDFAKQIAKDEGIIQSIISKRKKSKTNETVYTVPVVVHVIHTGEAVGVGHNISDAQINSGITQLNNAFRNTHGQSVDVKIQFELASKDPNCNATTGILRVDGSSVTDYATMGVERSTSDGAPVADIKALSYWNRDNYYNVWIINEIDNNDGGAGIQGFAKFPGGTAATDGTMILNSAWGDQGTVKSYTDEGKTIIHEFGHAFNLYHTFQGDNSGSSCPTEANGCAATGGSGDCVSDTPPHIRSASNCNSGGTNACDGGSSNALFVHNYMDYSSETCQYLFTTEQKARMRAALEGTRASLLSSKALSANMPSFSVLAASCTNTTSATGLGGGYAGIMNVQIEGKLNVSSSNTQNDGGYLDNATSCQGAAVLDVNGTYEFKTTVWVNTHYVKAWIDYDNDGTFEAGELIFDKSIAAQGTDSANFTVPGTATTGSYLRMRVLSDLSSFTDPCLNPTYGQAEDYVVFINSAATPPVAEFSASKTTVCVGETVTFNDASTNTPTGWSWTFNGGTPVSSTNQNQSVIFNTPGTYTISLEATNGDGSDTETKTDYISVVANPTVDLGSDAAICAGANTTLDAGNAGASYTWNDASTNQTLNASSAGQYHVAVTDGNGCIGRDTINVSVNTIPIVALGNDTSFCHGGSKTLNAANNGATYLWNDASTNQTLSVSSTGQFHVEVTDGNGCIGRDTINVTVNNIPSVALGNDTSICSGANITLDAGNTGASYIWNDASTNQTLSASTAGQFHAAVTDGNGCVGHDTINISLNTLPVVTLGNDTTFCQGGSKTLDAGNTGASFLWNDASTNQTLSASSAGQFHVAVTDVNGCVGHDTIDVTVNNNPNVDLGADPSICGGSNTTLDAGNAGATYLWNDASTNQTLTASVTGEYHVTVTDGNGCTGRDTVNVTVTANPTVNLGNDTSFCSGESFTLDAGSAANYLWSDASTNQTLVVNATGEYSVTVSEPSGCQGRDTINIIVNDLPALSVNSETICDGQSATLTATAPTALTYQWSGAGGAQNGASITATLAGNYNITVTDGTCHNTATAVVTVNSKPTVDLGHDQTLCSGVSATLDAGNAGASYLWNDASTNQTLIAASSGDYDVQVTDGNGCSARDTIAITVRTPVAVNLGNDTIFCEGGSVSLDAGNAGATFLWNDASANQTLLVTAAGQYHVTVTDGNNCEGKDTIVVTINNKPSLDLGADQSTCTAITLDAGSGGMSYLWSNGATSSNISVSPGTYDVVKTDFNNCVAKDTINITQGTTPTVNLGGNQSFCAGSSIILDAGNSGASYAWNNDGTGFNQNILVNSAGTYGVIVTDGLGCQGGDTVTVSETALPVVTNDPAFETNYDTNHGDVTLSFGQPAGGAYNGAGVTGGTFNTSMAGVGTHQITYTYTDFGTGCTNSTTLNVNVSPSTSLGALTGGSISASPNPFDDRISVTVPSGTANYRLSTLSGQALKTGQLLEGVNNLNTGAIARGAYLLTVSSERGTVSFKLVKR